MSSKRFYLFIQIYLSENDENILIFHDQALFIILIIGKRQISINKSDVMKYIVTALGMLKQGCRHKVMSLRPPNDYTSNDKIQFGYYYPFLCLWFFE